VKLTFELIKPSRKEKRSIQHCRSCKKCVRIVVEDNGRGFEMKLNHFRPHGLRICANGRGINAALEITSAPGKWNKVEIYGNERADQRFCGGRSCVVRSGLRLFLMAFPDLELVVKRPTGGGGAPVCSDAPGCGLDGSDMPVMNGVEATRAIRSVSANTQVIALTSFPEEQLVRTPWRQGQLAIC